MKWQINNLINVDENFLFLQRLFVVGNQFRIFMKDQRHGLQGVYTDHMVYYKNYYSEMR